LGGFNHRVECCEALQRYDGEPVIPYWRQSRPPRVLTRGRQLAKADENRAAFRENSAGASGEVD
jgi:hypothetical protein